MNFFRAKQWIYERDKGHGSELLFNIAPGQLFYVDASSDLPAENRTPEALAEHWEELVLHNNFGQIRLVPRK